MNMWHRANTISFACISLFSLVAASFVALSKLPVTNVSLTYETKQENEDPETVIQYVVDSSKDVWINKKGIRHHYHMESPQSRFILKNDLISNQIVEEMDDMRLWMQDRISQIPNPTQEIRFIKSPHSTFCFSDHSLKTENSFIALYTTPGKDLSLYLKPEQITLRGNAETFDVLVDKEGVKFAAKGFAAQINDIGKKYE